MTPHPVAPFDTAVQAANRASRRIGSLAAKFSGRLSKATAVCLGTTLLVAGAAWAAPQEEMVYYREGMRFDPVEVSRILAGGTPQRSIRLLPQAAQGEETQNAAVALATLPDAQRVTPNTTGTQLAAQASAPTQAASIALPVQFAFDSAEIAPQARGQLDAMAEGIKLLPATTRVIIEGHTDASGSHAYNLQLSRKRAEAVKRYLVTQHGLDAQRLSTFGFGPERPMDGFDASGAENRRVQFRGA